MNGRIIFLNGTSSAGKSTIAQALRHKLAPEFCYYASDHLADAGFRQLDATVRFANRQRFFEGFHRSIPAFASVGIDLLVEHIIEEQAWADALANLLANFDVFWVGVHAPIKELERREALRGDRTSGEARFHLKTHTFCQYHLQVDSTRPTEDVAAEILKAWTSRNG